MDFFYKRVSTFSGLFLHKKKRFAKELDKGRDITKNFNVVFSLPSPKLSSAKDVRLEVKRSKLGFASVSGYLLEGSNFIVDCIVEKEVTLLVIQAL